MATIERQVGIDAGEVKVNSQSQDDDNDITAHSTPEDYVQEEGAERIPTISGVRKDQRHMPTTRLFSLKNNGMRRKIMVSGGATGSYNYDEIYEEDQYGEEAFSEARVWKVYNAEAQIFDQDKIEAWRDALDVLLVFIGLFSAIVTTFVVQTSQSLQPDYAQMTVIITYEILRAISNSSLPTTPFSPTIMDPRFGIATPSNLDKAANALWFTSLAISLSTALLTVLTKQWLYHYTGSTSGSSRERARIRQYRFAGLQAYRVPLIIDLLPILLHASLALFLAGLAVFLYNLNLVMFGLVIGIAGVAYTLYLMSIIIPILDAQCPYKSPLSFYVYPLRRPAVRLLRRARRCLVIAWTRGWETLSGTTNGHGSGPACGLSMGYSISDEAGERHSLGEAETDDTLRNSPQLDIDALVWLHDTSGNSTARSISLEAFGGLAPSNVSTVHAARVLEGGLLSALRRCSKPNHKFNVPFPGMEARHDRLLRGFCIWDGAREAAVGLSGPHINGEKDTRKLFARWLLPWLQSSPGDSSSLRLLFPPTHESNPSFPISVWAMALRLAKIHAPKSPIIAIGILSTGFPASEDSRDEGDIGPVNLKGAMRNSYVRYLAMQYLNLPTSGQIDGDHMSTFLQSCISSLASPGNMHEVMESAYFFHLSVNPSVPLNPFPLSSIYDPLFNALQYNRNWTLYIEMEWDKSDRLMRNALHTFFQSSHPERVSWQSLCKATMPCQEGLPPICTPITIRRMIEQFHRRNNLEEKDFEWIQKTRDNLCGTFRGCMFAVSVELAEAICTALSGMDMLPPDSLCLGIFWSPQMCREVVRGTFRLKQQTQGTWFAEWLAYLHVPDRLTFLCQQLVMLDDDATLPRIQPQHSAWPTCLQQLLLLFNDQPFPDSLELDAPRSKLSKRLSKLKDILMEHHDLSDSTFDIPQFDDQDNLLSSNGANPRHVLNSWDSILPVSNDIDATDSNLPLSYSPLERNDQPPDGIETNGRLKGSAFESLSNSRSDVGPSQSVESKAERGEAGE